MNKSDKILTRNYDSRINQHTYDVSNIFNTYFANIGTNSTCKSRSKGTNEQHIPKDSMMLFPTDSREVKNAINSLKNSRTQDFYGISNLVVKKCANSSICEPLAKAINMSFEEGIFPSILKTTMILPIYKKGAKEDVKNYRLISILSPFGKIFEMIFLD